MVFRQINLFFKKRLEEKEIARRLYVYCCECARDPVFYQDGGVLDNEQGRFEMITVYLWLVMRHLRRLGAEGLLSRLAGIFFSEMDAAMREMGEGDMAVPREVKKLSEAFYGRLRVYDEALEAGDLSVPLGRNLSVAGALRLADYFTACDKALAVLPLLRFRDNSRLFCEPFKGFVG